MQVSGWDRLRTTVFLFISRFLRGMTLGVRVLMIRDGKVFLIRHTYYPGWHFPGGGVESGETMLEALKREMWEESGYRPSSAPELVGIFLNRRASKRDHVALYVCRDPDKGREFTPNREIAEAGWFTRDALPEPLGGGVLTSLEIVLDGTPVTEEW